eukprot:293267-Chlamydomonas_euryale.AAC.2
MGACCGAHAAAATAHTHACMRTCELACAHTLACRMTAIPPRTSLRQGLSCQQLCPPPASLGPPLCHPPPFSPHRPGNVPS